MPLHPLQRAILGAVGLVAIAAGIGLLVEGEADEWEEIVFASVVLGVGLLNFGIAVAGGCSRRIALAAVLADAAVIGTTLYAFSQISN